MRKRNNLLPLHQRRQAPDERLHYILSQILEIAPCEVLLICNYRRESGSFELLTSHHAESANEHTWEWVLRWKDEQSTFLAGVYEPRILKLGHVPMSEVHSVRLLPLLTEHGETLIGMIFMFAVNVDAFEDTPPPSLNILTQLAQTVLENMALTHKLITTEAVATTAQAIARNPSPQNIVHAMRDYLFNVQVSGCAIGLFGPVRSDHPNGPFDYIEIKGSWSRQLGSKVGIDLRFDLAIYEEILNQLKTEKTLTIHNVEDNLPPKTDEFVRMMLQIDPVKTITLILLESERSLLGILAIFSKDEYDLTLYELQAYQVVGEFLTMSTLASVLQAQANFVTQGRAALLDAVTDSVVMVLTDASVLTVNNHFTRMFGLKEWDVQGISIYDLLEEMQIPSNVRRELSRQWNRKSKRDYLEGEFSMVSMNGTQSDIQWYSAPVYQDNQTLGHIYTFHDITPERTAERLRSELLSRISHELRTPLTSIRGFAEFILEVSGDDLPPLAREYTEIIQSSADHLNHLFTDMIEINRANAGELKLHITKGYLTDVVMDVITRMRPQLTQRKQTVITEVDHDLPPTQLDLDRIYQVVTNLVSNAIKYAPEGSEITLMTAFVEKDTDLPQSAPVDVVVPCALIGVIDQGEGIDAEDADKIFLPFYRTRIARRNKVEGAGLGLAIVQSIVELHRGHIWVEPNSKKATGGRFFFTIPIEAAP